MVSNWLDPQELVFPMFCLVVTVWVGFAFAIFYSHVSRLFSERARARHYNRMRAVAHRMYDDFYDAPIPAPRSVNLDGPGENSSVTFSPATEQIPFVASPAGITRRLIIPMPRADGD